jgi:hypothetical protein
MPAGLVKLLLLKAGIEPNPGPIYICPVCNVELRRNSRSVQCCKCLEWIHFRSQNNCSNLKSTTKKDYDKNTYVCPSCLNDPLTLPNNIPTTTTQPSTIHQPSTNPQPSTPRQPRLNLNNDNIDYKLNILQWNCNGIKTKTSDLISFINEHQIKVVVLQETKLSSKSAPPDIPDFTMIRKDRKNNGGGVAIFVHKSILFAQAPDLLNDGHTESNGISIGNIKIRNVYIPPVNSCAPGFEPDIKAILSEPDSLILGDFNAHNPLWYSSIQDARGDKLAEEISESDFGVLNENVPTRLPSFGQPTSPDISLASTSLLPYIEWETKTALSSDHLPIIIKINTSIQTIKSDYRKFINFKKADWDKFTNITEERFSRLPEPDNIHNAEKKFRKILNKASKKTIPGGRIKDIIPEIPTATTNKMKERDNLRETNPDSPDIQTLNREILQEVNLHRKNKWREKINEITSGCSSKLFKLIKNLNGKGCSNSNQAIKFKGRYLTSSLDIANGFNKQYSSVVRHISSKTSRCVTRNIKKNSLEDPPSFTTQQTAEAIKASKASKAAGPDNISNLHLKHLGPIGVSYLTKIFNLSLALSIIPDIWKNSVIIPLLKPGKDPQDSNSYRPVSLLCPAIKILERLILPALSESLEIPVFQHGFRKNHSTVSALNDFNDQVASGFSKKRPPDRTVLLQIDLSKAFDMVSHDKLLKDLGQSSLSDPLKRWFNCYLKGRQSRVNFRNTTSKCRNIRAGVPQGAVTSPILFNYYLRNLPNPPKNVQVVQYADDISIYSTGLDINALTEAINKFVPKVIEFLNERELIVSPEKSTVTLFTPDTKEYKIHPKVLINNIQVKLEHEPKLLGVTYDTMLTFSKHIRNITSAADTKINMLKSLCGTDWGQDKETMTMTYKAIARSAMEYACPIWSPIISDSNWEKLQVSQNKALKVSTGTLKITPYQHIHHETKVLPIREHCMMKTKQYLLTCHLPEHPGNKHVDKPLPARKHLKPTIQNFRNSIQQHLPINAENRKAKLKAVHTSEVKNTLENLPPNDVLGCKPPEINKEELSLPRHVRTQLSQLRSGFSRKLNSYLTRLDNTVEDKCPNCSYVPHDTAHLFNCPDDPTTLTVVSLWTKPKQAAEFLKLDEGST